MMTPFLLAVALAAAAAPAAPAPWTPQASGSTAELRGLAVHDATRAWASGAGGTVLRTRDGKRWEKLKVPGGEALDFRDIAALDARTVILMSAGTGDLSRIYRSTDGGTTWKLVHTNPDKDGFYDAIAFWDEKHGLVVGDPVDGRFTVRVTDDGGVTWATPPDLLLPMPLPGEGAFAASGTCLFALAGGTQAWFVTGGARVARVYRTHNRGRTWNSAATSLPAGNASTGLFSVAFLDKEIGFVSGGDYKQPELAAVNGARSKDGGRTWTPVPIAATGFYSAVVPVPGANSTLLAVGPVGTAISRDAGRSWAPLDQTPLNAVAFADSGAGWAVGPKGTIARWSPPAP
jgi:photosystem II stability/assembly factor-like uncharacterized protein